MSYKSNNLSYLTGTVVESDAFKTFGLLYDNYSKFTTDLQKLNCEMNNARLLGTRNVQNCVVSSEAYFISADGREFKYGIVSLDTIKYKTENEVTVKSVDSDYAKNSPYCLVCHDVIGSNIVLMGSCGHMCLCFYHAHELLVNVSNK